MLELIPFTIMVFYLLPFLVASARGFDMPVAFLLANLALVPHWGVNGAAAATSISVLSGTVYFRYLSRRHLDYHVPLLRMLVLLVPFCLTLSAAWLVRDGIAFWCVFLLGSLVLCTMAWFLKLVRASDASLIVSKVKVLTVG